MEDILKNDLLFPTFLEDKNVYNLAEAWWRRLVQSIADEAGLTFQPFYTKRYGSGEKIYDGNPIFDAYFPQRHKLIRILQELPDPNDPGEPFTAWIDHWPVTEMDEKQKPHPADPAKLDESIPELVIALELTEATAERARAVIRRWVVEDAPASEMEQYLQH